ncbi:MAG: hypothetical protein ABIT70_02410 [Sulfuriferula sp.]
METEFVEVQNANDDQIVKIVIDGVGNVMDQLPATKDRELALGFLMMQAYYGMRALQGDKFVEGWLEMALEELKTPLPKSLITQPAKH